MQDLNNKIIIIQLQLPLFVGSIIKILRKIFISLPGQRICQQSGWFGPTYPMKAQKSMNQSQSNVFIDQVLNSV